MEFYYSTDRNVQNLVYLLKAHGIKHMVVSPGTTNVCLIASLQHEGSFALYSCVDERSAAYMACGMAAESGEPVAIVCTEATASRNYYPGLTEAFHRKLPILAITFLHGYDHIGNLEPQVIDRSASPVDTFRLKVHLPVIKDEQDVRESAFKINRAILELSRNGGGPVHLNVPWSGGVFDFSVQQLPTAPVLQRLYDHDLLPEIPEGKVLIYCGVHRMWDLPLTQAVETFCAAYDSIVLGGPTGGYRGKYQVAPALLEQSKYWAELFGNVDLVIHIGEEPGDYMSKIQLSKTVKEVWRVSPDGELRDMFGKLSKVFEMQEFQFFQRYSKGVSASDRKDTFLTRCKACLDAAMGEMTEVPFSNVYVASKVEPRLPEGSVLHLGMSTTVRAWSLFEPPHSVQVFANLGCRGIDGTVSALVGASQVHKDKLYFGIVGDLTFFYDMNVLGNRHVGKNLRLLLINNNGGTLFRNTDYTRSWLGSETTDQYIAAGGHFGKKSPLLVRHYAEDLGFEYLRASNPEELETACRRFLLPEIGEKPMLLEVFTEDSLEGEAFSVISRIGDSSLKRLAKNILGEEGKNAVKKFLKR